MNRVFSRTYQTVMRGASYFMPFRRPEILSGEGAALRLPERVRREGVRHLLFFVGKSGQRMPFYAPLLEAFRAEGIEVTVYNGTVPNPTVDNVEEALALFRENGCDGLLAMGGGSQMDCAKITGARIVRPGKTVRDLKGLLKVGKKIPPLFVIPTTAGSGSEVTVAAVVSIPDTHEKFGISDPALIPLVAVLDPLGTVSLPPHVTAETGMDALTHAVEAYIGRSNTKETARSGLHATKLIFESLLTAYSNGADTVAREKMLRGSYEAGIAFTRAYVGYVHALAHAIGGQYGVAHGQANAILLPLVLEAYGESAHRRLAELADAAGIDSNGDPVAADSHGMAVLSNQEKAAGFIAAIRRMNDTMGIPRKIAALNESDIPLLTGRAAKEANPLYPVPRILNEDELAAILKRAMFEIS